MFLARVTGKLSQTIPNRLNKNRNTSRNRLNRDRNNVLGRGDWLNDLDLLSKSD